MKYLTRIVILSALLSYLNTYKLAAQDLNIPQNQLHIGLGAEIGLPTGQLGDFYNFTVGGTFRLQYDLQGPVSIIVSSGYTSFIGKQVINGVTFAYSSSSYNRYPSYNLVPLKVGFKAFASSNFYVSVEGGAGFETNSGGSTKLLLSPGFGYTSQGRSGWDFGLRYDNISGQNTRSGQFVARVGYDF